MILFRGESKSLQSALELNLPTVVVIHRPGAGQYYHLEAVLHLLHPRDDLGLLQGVVPLEESVAALLEDVLLFHLGEGYLQDGCAALREGLQSADVADHQFVRLLVLVQGQYHPAGEEVQLEDVEGHLPTLVPQSPRKAPRRISRSRSPTRPLRGRKTEQQQQWQ